MTETRFQKYGGPLDYNIHRICVSFLSAKKKYSEAGILVPDYPRKLLVFKIMQSLIDRPGKLTGDEVHFIRSEFGLSKSKLGQYLEVSHTAVAKWEDSGRLETRMDKLKDRELRVAIFKFIAKELKLQKRQIESEFYRIYCDTPKNQSKKNAPLTVNMNKH